MKIFLCIFMLILQYPCRVRLEDIILKCDEYSNNAGVMDKFCTISGFYVTHSQNVKIPQHLKANQTNFMKFYNSVLLFIPAKLFDVFANLKTLDVSNTEIGDISRNTFTSASLLTTLNLSHNKIEKITTSVFVGAHNLMRLDLSYNQLHTINDLAFRGLGNMNKVILSQNLLSELPNDLFIENSYMDSVLLDNNQLTELSPEVFNHLRHIRDLDLANNSLRKFDPDTFSASYGPEILSLANNDLQEFHLTNKSVTKRLDLDSNRLTALQINGTTLLIASNNSINSVQIYNAAGVNMLMLQRNQLKDITNITSMTHLTDLDLSWNPVGTPNITTFQNLTRLTTLNLRATGISSIQFGMFSKLPSLDVLDLSYNNLTELNLDMFVPSNVNIRTFLADANNLTEIQGKYTFSKAFPQLTELGISRNQFNCSYLHWLLIKPQLSDYIKLHIEHDDRAEETTHIRDVTCISHVQEDLEKAENNLENSKHLENFLQQSVDQLSLHAKQMQSYLLVLSLILSCLIVLMCSVCIGMALHYWRQQRKKYFQRRGAAIVFHSNATVNTHVDQ